MLARWGKNNASRLARESEIGLGTIGRIQGNDATSVALDKIERLAAVFDVNPWDLLNPNFDPYDKTNKALSPKAMALAQALDQITDPIHHDRAYAMAQQVISFANLPHGDTPKPGDATKP